MMAKYRAKAGCFIAAERIAEMTTKAAFRGSRYGLTRETFRAMPHDIIIKPGRHFYASCHEIDDEALYGIHMISQRSTHARL